MCYNMHRQIFNDILKRTLKSEIFFQFVGKQIELNDKYENKS